MRIKLKINIKLNGINKIAINEENKEEWIGEEDEEVQNYANEYTEIKELEKDKTEKSMEVGELYKWMMKKRMRKM